ncbi:MAG: ATP-binding cassette domain-containing protein [Saprospiraceae bacterium]|nr:ATP-binding cassette domain-containing protein [Saprospiraceae bacterium]
MNPQAVLIVENLSVDILRAGQRKPVLRDIHLTVNRGEIHALVGVSGSGKTTLAMMISGILPRDMYEIRSGHIWFTGQEGMIDLLSLDWPTRQQWTGRHINMIFQEPSTAFNSVRTIGEQLVETGHVPIEKELLQACSRSLGLDPDVLWDRYPWQLSGGQQQRFLLARSLVLQPDIILADEPTSALDHHHQQEFLRDMQAAVSAENGPGMLLVSHDRALVSQVADRVTEIRDGKIFLHEVQTEGDLPSSSKDTARTRATIQNGDYQAGRETLLSIQHLTAGYTSDTAVLTDIQMNIQAGELIGVAGSSGSGKSSMLRGMLGLMPWQTGLRKPGPALAKGLQSIQLVYQDPGRSLNPVMTMEQTMTEWADAYDPAAIERLHQILEEVGLEVEMMDRLPHMFSGGQRQRMAIARALLTHPGVLLADEPFSNLDADLRDQMMQVFHDLVRHRQIGVVVVAHDLPRLERFCDRILLLKEGRIQWEGPPDELAAQREDWILELRGNPDR